ncbi:MAG: SPOR domain-containing protein [Bacteroidales bacterium]|nr:SPOR domain-containing protein [Bacteroidales bacterium]
MLRKLTFKIVTVTCFAFTLLGITNLKAQEVSFPSQVEIIQDSIIDSLVNIHKKYNALNNKMDGFRIQIYFESGNNSKTQSIEIREEFLKEFPDIRAYITFKEPYYRVRIGDYRTRLQADGVLKGIKRTYPNAFVIKDQINFPQLYKEQIIDLEEIIDADE